MNVTRKKCLTNVRALFVRANSARKYFVTTNVVGTNAVRTNFVRTNVVRTNDTLEK
jgi:hypothetical protein